MKEKKQQEHKDKMEEARQKIEAKLNARTDLTEEEKKVKRSLVS